MILHDVEVDGVAELDVLVEGDRITEIGTDLARAGGSDVLDGQGGALVPGLHDHHLHLRAMAARARSVPCGPPEVTNGEDLTVALRTAASDLRPGEWVRGTGYDETVAGPLDRHGLDAILSTHPVRLQHRSGHLWVLNGPALEMLGLDHDADADGLLYDQDVVLRDRVGPPDGLDLAALRVVGERLASLGVTGFTDATASNGRSEADTFALMAGTDVIRQKVLLLGDDHLPVPVHPLLRRGARKVILAEHDLPDLDEVISTIARSHHQGRPVAIHAASRETLVLALAALDAAGTVRGDRIEHASVAPPETVEWLARLDVAVITQHGFLADRGDRYLDQVEDDDQPWLYRGRGFLEGGVRLAGSTDAPFGPDDPWDAMRSAVDRHTASGRPIGVGEALSPEAALGLFTGPAEDPGAARRPVVAGAPADLCLLSVPWAEARCRLSADDVAATLVNGTLVFER